MPDASKRWCLRHYSLGTEWQLVDAEIHCNKIVMAANVGFLYCSDKDLGDEGSISVPADMERPIEGSISTVKDRPRFICGEGICWVKGQQQGTIWIQYIY